MIDGKVLNIYLRLTNGNQDLDLFEFAEEILKTAQEETTQSVMSKNCACYKLGYSALNNYTKVEKELLTKGEVK
jgi:hypothetical protein